MASDLIDKIKLSIHETALRLISENNKALGSPDVLIQSLQSHTEDIESKLKFELSNDDDFGSTEDEALHDIIREFFDKLDLTRVVSSTNQQSIQKMASLMESKDSKSFLRAQRLFRIFCESGDIPSFDNLTQQLVAFTEGVGPSDGFTFLSAFDSRSPRLIGSPKLPSDLIGTTEIDVESILSKIRPHWSAFIERVAEDLCQLERTENLNFAKSLVSYLEENQIQKDHFKSLYRLEHSLKSSHQTLGAPKVRGGISDLLNLIKVSCQSRFQNLFSDAWESVGEILDTTLIGKLTDSEWLQHFDPYTVLLSASGVSKSKAALVVENVDEALESSESLFSELAEDLRVMLNDSDWISESGSLTSSRPSLASPWTLGDLTYNRNYTEAKISDVTYSFSTPMQQSVLEWLIEDAKRGQLPIDEKDLLEKLQRVHKKRDRQFKSLRDAVFKTGGKDQKKHPAWGKLIILKNKQIYLVTDKTIFSGQP